MTLAQLHTFLAVCQNMSFTEAARHQYISQPAVSRQMAALEDELGAELFERSRSAIQLTPAGEHLARRLKPLLDHMDALLNQVHEMGTGQLGSLSIGLLIDQNLDQYISAALQHFRHRHNASISIFRYNLIDLIAGLKSRSIDLAVSIDSTGGLFGDCERYIYTSDSMCFAVRKDLLSQIGDKIDKTTLEGISDLLPILVPRLDAFPKDQHDILFNKLHDENFATVDREYDLASIAPMVSAGLAATVVNATHDLTVDQTIALIPMQHLPTIDKGIFWLKDNSNPMIALFLNCLQDGDKLPPPPPEL